MRRSYYGKAVVSFTLFTFLFFFLFLFFSYSFFFFVFVYLLFSLHRNDDVDDKWLYGIENENEKSCSNVHNDGDNA